MTSNEITMQMGTTSVAAVSGWEGAVSLYPNPNTGQFTISSVWSMAHVGKRVSIDITSAVGQRVYHTELTPNTRTWSHMVWLGEHVANGTYLLRLATDDGMRATVRFVVDR